MSFGLLQVFHVKFWTPRRISNCVDSQVQDKTLEEGQKMYQPKHDYNNIDEVNSPNFLSYNNYQASSQKFRQVKLFAFQFALIPLGKS